MAIAKTVRRQRDFSAGQVDAMAERRTDLKLVDAGLKKALNCHPLPSGGIGRRPGRVIRYFDGLPSVHDIIRMADGAVVDIGFYPGRFIARDVGGGILDSIPAPWQASQLPELHWAASDRQVFVTHKSFAPQVLTLNPAAGTWSRANLDFADKLDGGIRAPFYRFDNFGVTLRPSARTGTITLTASDNAPVFRSSHIGMLFEWGGRQVVILSVQAPWRATASVLEELPPTYHVTLGSGEAGGFRVGEIVEGADSGTVGEVVLVTDSLDRITVLTTNNFRGFDDAEDIVSPSSRGTVVSSVENVPTGPSVQWREQFLSGDRGYPQAVAIAHQRLIFTDFPQRPDAVLMSAIGLPDDFEIGADADDAILEFVPLNCRVLHAVPEHDLIFLTDAGPFYVPVSASNPLAPGSVSFKRIGTDGASHHRPVGFASGVLYPSIDGRRLMAIVPTGQTAQPYIVQSLTDYHRDLFPGIAAIAYSDGTADVPGSRVYVVNDDGTVVVGKYIPGEEFVGWFPWDGQGEVLSVAAGFGAVVFVTEYVLGNGNDTVYVGEEMSLDTYLDGTIALETEDSWQDSTGTAWTTSTGLPWRVNSGFVLPFAGNNLVGWADGFYLGPINVDNDGLAEVDSDAYDDITVGWSFTPEVQPFIPIIEGGADNMQGLRKRKIAKAAVTVRDTQTFIADRNHFGGYKVGENQEEPRPERDATFTWRRLGRSHDPTVEISQPVPGSFNIIEIAIEVTV